MDRFERLRKRLHMLQTKPGELTPGEQFWIRYLEEILTSPGISKDID